MSLILDCAEAEFARRGYDGTTLAAVAKSAGVDSALMRYYFVNKKRLFIAVVKRRSEPSNVHRQKAMAEYRRKAGDHMTLEGIIDAFTRPAFELGANDEGWRHYAAIITFVAGGKGWLRDLMNEMFDHVSRELIEDMHRILPHAHKEDLYWAYHFMTAAYTASIGVTERIDILSGGTVSSSDFANLARRLPIFVVAANKFFVLFGPSYVARCWCMLEVSRAKAHQPPPCEAASECMRTALLRTTPSTARGTQT